MTSKQLKDREAARELASAFNSFPGTSKTCTTAVLREFLLADDGFLRSQGHRFTINSKSLGAGVYRVWLDT